VNRKDNGAAVAPSFERGLRAVIERDALFVSSGFHVRPQCGFKGGALELLAPENVNADEPG
jgi:hypothetical protein